MAGSQQIALPRIHAAFVIMVLCIQNSTSLPTPVCRSKGEHCYRNVSACPNNTTPSNHRCPAKQVCCEDKPEYASNYSTVTWESNCGVVYSGGKPKRYQSQVVGGSEAVEGAIPWQVALLEDGYHACGGALLNHEWVVTAGHCVDDGLAEYEVVLGEHDRSAVSPRELRLQIPSGNIKLHPEYNLENKENDIALIKLPSTVTYTNYIRPICRPDTNVNFKDATCRVSGWGATSYGDGKVYVLRYADVSVVDTNLCAETYGGVAGLDITEANLCAGGESANACQGDSGGPLACNVGGKYALAGVVSWGRQCGELGHPGVYSKIQYHLSWIDGHLISGN